jgi:putative transposase
MVDWPHAPVHRLSEAGAYLVTAGTYQKQPYLKTAEHLSIFQDALFSLAETYQWRLQAWSILSNHYHFLALSPTEPDSLKELIRRLHGKTARELNRLDAAPGRKVWFQYRDSYISQESSYLARLRYVHFNPVHHGVVRVAEQYPWCSAAWFEQNAAPAFRKTVLSFPTDRINLADDF